ncbi:hypothetical protein RKE38_13970 [Phycicoccus sp. M110.8]|uniref:hypothetical protein n=1 Tax=Phycicoccus sp. M110.8 TaxID=3075433 RepID=UPI0028FD3A1A|nr:hypothetical protein [Phycicoccus sp. M110.8]MDU0314801.1 hypothetical protein [Phycicoccus sp. M110.8]
MAGVTRVEWGPVLEAVEAAQRGDGAAARAALERRWVESGTDEHAVRCVVAHYLADLQDDLDAEIAWDERALESLPHVRDEDVAGLGITSAAGFAPSLHLNLGDGYLRRGDVDRARQHLDAGTRTLEVLGDDPYGVMIRRGFERLATRIESPDALPRRR